VPLPAATNISAAIAFSRLEASLALVAGGKRQQSHGYVIQVHRKGMVRGIAADFSYYTFGLDGRHSARQQGITDEQHLPCF
jgi:hypothetical protein